MVTPTDSRTKWSIFNNPLPLLEINNKKVLSAIDSYLPFSVGMEIECMHSSTFNAESFTSIPDIMDVSNYSPEYEQRYRIPSGLKGLVCLWNICEQLKLNCKYNSQSGHHYHIDCTDVFSNVFRDIASRNEDWILKELDDWKYSGNYNYRNFGGWYRENLLGTLEFRNGDMTFEYPVMVKRIIHASDIVRRLKIEYYKGPASAKLHNINRELKKLEEQEQDKILFESSFRDVAEQVVKSRTIKI